MSYMDLILPISQEHNMENLQTRLKERLNTLRSSILLQKCLCLLTYHEIKLMHVRSTIVNGALSIFTRVWTSEIHESDVSSMHT